ncbi:MAG: formyltransferase family protein [Planctomycetota bacterium]|nr:formyltransferase family protein [Planctomycetota bacterium]
MKRVVILTGSEARHTFFRKYIARSADIAVCRTYCEGLERNLAALVAGQDDNSLRSRHLAAREQSEADFFTLFNEHVADESNPCFRGKPKPARSPMKTELRELIPKGDINLPEHAESIIKLEPDLLVSYGCSIICEPLLSAFHRRFINVHLGLSPYYRGSGTNFWPLVNSEPEYVGATFMHIDAGVDTGEVIHQIRARMSWGDTPSSIGNRLIMDMAAAFERIIRHFDHLSVMEQIPKPDNDRYYRQRNYTEESVTRLYEQFRDGLVEQYLAQEINRCQAALIISNPGLELRS